MSPVAKVVIGIVISVVLVVILCVALAAWWFVSHKDQLSKQLIEGPMQDGKTFGKTTDNNGCVTEALARNKKNTSVTGTFSNDVFLESCLENSKSSPNFCGGVPKPTSFIDSTKWLSQQCQQRAPGDTHCPQLFQQVQRFCYSEH